jgi:hypothetical protein
MTRWEFMPQKRAANPACSHRVVDEHAARIEGSEIRDNAPKLTRRIRYYSSTRSTSTLMHSPISQR